jgi:lambda repressor-like predicted transcriptional regulator
MSQKKEEVTMSQKERYRFIRSEMVRRGITNKLIADEAEVSREYVFMVLNSERKGYRVRLIVAKKCDLPVQTLWPDTPSQYREAA